MGDYADDFGEPPEPRGKKKGGGGFLKFCLVCGCIVLLLAGLAGAAAVYAVSQAVSMDPTTVAARAQEIIPCTIPPGYQGAMAFRIPFVGVSMVMIGPPGMLQNQQGTPPGQSGMMIMLLSIPPGQNPQQLQNQMQAKMQQQGQGGPNTQLQVESTQARTFKIRGADVEFTEQVGVQQSGQGAVRMRQLTAMIPHTPGSADQVLIMIMGPEQGFDQAALEAFLGSIR
jgi:hypothetical protein